MRWLLLVSCFLAPAAALAQESEKVGLDTFLTRAQANDAEIEQLLHARVATSFLRDLSLPPPTLVLDSDGQVGFALNSGNRTTSFAVGLTKLFPRTGTEVGATFNFNEQVDRQERVTTVRATQPLWRNAFGRQTRDLVAQFDQETEATHLEVAEALEDHVALLIATYLDWQLAHLSVQLARQQHAESLELRRTIEARRRRGVAAPVDLERVTLEALTREQTLLERQVTFAGQTAAIARILGDPSRLDLVPDLAPTAFAVEPAAVPAPEEPRTLQALSRAEAAGNLNVAILRQDLQPSLNFVAGVRDDQSTRFRTSIDRQEAFVGLEMQWPFVDSQAKARVRQAQYDRTTTQLAIQAFRQNFAASLQAQRATIEARRARDRVSRARKEAAARVVEMETLRYQRGQSQLETLIQARQSLAEAEHAELANAVALNQALVEWLRLVDGLVVEADEIRVPR